MENTPLAELQKDLRYLMEVNKDNEHFCLGLSTAILNAEQQKPKEKEMVEKTYEIAYVDGFVMQDTFNDDYAKTYFTQNYKQ